MDILRALFLLFLLLFLLPIGSSKASEYEGFYLGLQLGTEALNSDDKGPRAAGTTKADDIGGFGVSGGILGGYGKTFGRVYFGGELELDFSSSDPASVSFPGRRTFSISKDYSLGFSGRLGYLVNDRFLLYGRLGIVQARFDTDLTTDLGVAFDSKTTKIGGRFGLGAEIALTPNSFFRLDYTLTNYNDYNVGWTDSTFSGVDNFDNDESLFRVGYIYRFSPGSAGNQNEPLAEGNTSSILSGFYFGGLLGGTQLSTKLTGPRAGPSNKADDVSNIGLSGGMFGGYGTRVGKWFLGMEVEGNITDVEWVTERAPTDRRTQVRKEYDIAGTFIGGYLVNDSMLIYGRLGASISRFNTRLRLGDGRTFDQSDSPIGLRLGIGTDLAITNNFFIRLDYIYNIYSTYGLDFSSPGQIASNDRRIDKFNNDEMTLRIGLGYRFDSDFKKDSQIAQFLKDQKPGFAVGNFKMLPTLVVSETYDDNIFANESSEEEDFITTISPNVTVESNWEQHKLSLYSGADIEIYRKDSNQDIENFWVGGDGRYEINKNAGIFGGGRVKYDHVDRQDVNEAFGITPTRFIDNQGHLGVYHTIDKFTLRAGGTFQQLDFDNVFSSAGPINNNDRDRKLYTGGARLGYQYNEKIQYFIQGSYDERRYDLNFDDGGFHRDSDGLRVASGFLYKFNPSAQAEVFGGYIYQGYEDPRLKNVSTYDIGAKLTWKMSPVTSLALYVDRTAEETIIFNASSYISTLIQASLQQNISKSIELNWSLVYLNNNFSGIIRNDNSIYANFDLRYFFHKKFYIGIAYQHSNRDSNIAGQDYQRNLGTLQAGVDF